MFVFTTLSAENATRLELPPPVNISPANVAHYEKELIKSRHTKRMFVALLGGDTRRGLALIYPINI